MKKYVAPVIEAIEMQLSECIATECDGSCPYTGYFPDGNGGKVYLTADSASGV